MRTRIVLFVLLVGVISGCNTERVSPLGDVIKEDRELSGFTSIDVSNALDVEIKQVSEDEKVMVKAHENILPYILTEVESGTLKISRKKNVNFTSDAKVKIYVKAINLDELEVSGASSVKLMNQLKSKAIELEVSGASSLEGKLKGKMAEMDISGASWVELKGEIDMVEAEVSGASDCESYDLLVEKLYADVSGASNAEFSVSEELSVSASGGSSFSYKGRAKVLEKDISGGSSFEKK